MIKLSCKSCGAKLELTDDIDRFACAHCGVEWIVNKSGGIVSLKNVENTLNEIKEKTGEIVEELKVSQSEEFIRKQEQVKLQIQGENQLKGCFVLIAIASIIWLVNCVYSFMNNNPLACLQVLLTLPFLGIALSIVNLLSGTKNKSTNIVILVGSILFLLLFAWLDMDQKRTWGDSHPSLFPEWMQIYFLPVVIAGAILIFALRFVRTKKP